MKQANYPGVLERVKAVTVDGIILIILIAIASSIFNELGEVPDKMRIVVFILIFGLYDPILTSTIGGTVGHRIIGLRVSKASDETSKINILFAIVRFTIKGLLGWISLLTVMSNDKHKAIHDYIALSVVVYKKTP